MKICQITLVLSLFFLSGFSQNQNFGIHGRYSHSVTKEKLNEAKLIRDFVPGYPVNWISKYVSVEILATCSGKKFKAVSTNETLSKEQLNILHTVDLATEIVLNINYKYENSVTNKLANYNMNISFMVIPEKEAEYIGGRQELNKYLREKVVNNISASTLPDWLVIPDQYKVGKVTFAINENGDIIDIKLSESTGDPKTDFLLLDAIYKMPKWKPAQTAKGIKVKQEFIFSYGSGGC